MRPSHLLFLFTLFHHHRTSTPQPTKKDVAAFVNKAEKILSDYKSGDVFQWLEEDMIVCIEQDIDYLRRNPKTKDALKMEARIVAEVNALYDYDQQAQQDISNKLTTPTRVL